MALYTLESDHRWRLSATKIQLELELCSYDKWGSICSGRDISSSDYTRTLKKVKAGDLV